MGQEDALNKAKIANLESRVDMLESELSHLDALLRECGFPKGIETLKVTVEELLKESRDDSGGNTSLLDF